MKRLIVTITILMLIPGITNARVGSDYRVYYTPYALSYDNPGLVSGLRYSPYALSPENPSGLAPVGARWSFWLQRLIVDTGYRSWYGFHPRAYYHRDAVINVVEYDVHPPYHAVYYKQVRLVCGAPARVTTEQPSWEEMKREKEQQRKVRQALQRQLRKEADERKERRAKDGRWTIFDFLKDKEIPCQMDGISVEGVTFAARFQLTDKNLTIVYLNQKEINSFLQEESKTPVYQLKALDDYIDSLAEFCKAYDGRIEQIVSSDKEEVEKAMAEICKECNLG